MAGLKCSSFTLSKGGTPPYGPVHGSSSGFATVAGCCAGFVSGCTVGGLVPPQAAKITASRAARVAVLRTRGRIRVCPWGLDVDRGAAMGVVGRAAGGKGFQGTMGDEAWRLLQVYSRVLQ